MIAVVKEHGPQLGYAPACQAVGIARATFYRYRTDGQPRVKKKRRMPKQALTSQERQEVLDCLHEPRFVDLAPNEVFAQLLDEDKYLCSPRTMYRLLEQNNEVRERRRQRKTVPYSKPELLATGPNQVWSWDITKLHGPEKWQYYYLYVLMDIFSRYVVGWLLAERESGTLAKHLIAESCLRQGIAPQQLVIHSDRGAAMRSQTLAQTMVTLGVAQSFSRPHVSDDNPFSESQYKTLKYRLDFPVRFTSMPHAENHCQDFFAWYNQEHHHVSLGLMTPHDVHYGLAQEKWRQRERTLAAAFKAHPERFPRGTPSPPLVPSEVWINKPQVKAAVAEPADQRAPESAQAGVAVAENDNAVAAFTKEPSTEKTAR